MKVDLKKLPDCKRLLEIELSAEEVAPYFEFAYKELGKEAEVPGFRRGKVPFDILKKRFSGAAAKRAFENIILNVYAAAVREKSIVPVADPAIDTAGKLPCEGEAFRFKATIEVWPEVKIDDYKGIVVEKEDFKISEEDVDAVLEMEQQKNADFIPIKERPARKDDWLLIDFESSINGSSLQSRKDFLFRLGSNTFPAAVEDSLIGCREGERKEIEVSDDSSETNRSPTEKKKILYQISLKGVREKRRIVVDDAFARKVGGFDSLSELRRDIQRRLEERAEREVQLRAESRLMDELVKKAEIEALPASLVEGQLEHLMFISQIDAESSGAEKDSEELKQRFRLVAERQVRTVLILDEIAQRENIAVTDEEVEKELARKKKKTEEERENLRPVIRRRNAVDFLMEHAEIRKKESSVILTPDQASSVVPEKKGGDSHRVSPGGIIIP